MMQLVWFLIIPIVMHGLYNTLLTFEQPALALVAALVSICWLAWQIEGCRGLLDHQANT
jgi:RsiW-degrading membrane proteinase PrsW (M82 family)